MKLIRYTLLADGSSDAILLPIINWLITQNSPGLGVQSQFANNLGTIGAELEKRIPVALCLFPCDILFVHRDGEGSTYDDRLQEITSVLAKTNVNYVPIIPIKMTEAWLFSDEIAIRSAAGNKNGKIPLNLPMRKNWDKLPDPKKILFTALETASEKTGRALRKFYPDRQRARVAEFTQDFSSLRGLPCFDSFETLLIEKLKGV